jgi:hypothetical protein
MRVEKSGAKTFIVRYRAEGAVARLPSDLSPSGDMVL